LPLACEIAPLGSKANFEIGFYYNPKCIWLYIIFFDRQQS